MAGRDYRPAANSPLINKGAPYPGMAASDLIGKARFLEKAPDIGCYEMTGAFTVIMVK